ncbi:benomyl/methotrexate resistance protein [Metarhizium album ARSEF 1941]|uniref:Benomyl/methotrexate resistance protein n=1 Tax=Metarhizium album (strain ARSEF 1941) TaxID=1081103 RepID=A0A0B2WM25_METAS|nr:benomyl/methotrexate resistance protein [Metarhizium album ARSEF 1941]KHN97106.1 benomyl/methotrexate resistance protein [Metarhizium album ARSEF 1941]
MFAIPRRERICLEVDMATNCHQDGGPSTFRVSSLDVANLCPASPANPRPTEAPPNLRSTNHQRVPPEHHQPSRKVPAAMIRQPWRLGMRRPPLPPLPRPRLTPHPRPRPNPTTSTSSSTSSSLNSTRPSSTATVTAAEQEEPSMTPAESAIADLLRAKLQPTELLVRDVSGGCGSMYAIDIASPAFKGATMLKQQRMVNAALADVMRGWHGVQLNTRVSE